MFAPQCSQTVSAQNDSHLLMLTSLGPPVDKHKIEKHLWEGAHVSKLCLYMGPVHTVHIAVCSQTCVQLQNCTFCALFRPAAQQKVD